MYLWFKNLYPNLGLGAVIGYEYSRSLWGYRHHEKTTNLKEMIPSAMYNTI